MIREVESRAARSFTWAAEVPSQEQRLNGPSKEFIDCDEPLSGASESVGIAPSRE